MKASLMTSLQLILITKQSSDLICERSERDREAIPLVGLEIRLLECLMVKMRCKLDRKKRNSLCQKLELLKELKGPLSPYVLKKSQGVPLEADFNREIRMRNCQF